MNISGNPEEVQGEIMRFLSSLPEDELDSISISQPVSQPESSPVESERGSQRGEAGNDIFSLLGSAIIHDVIEPPIPEIDSDDDSISSDASDTPARHRGEGVKWVKILDFADEDEAEAWINDGKLYAVQRRNYTKKYGFKHYYYCKQCGKASVTADRSRLSTQQNGPPVGVQIMLHYVNTSRRVDAYVVEANGKKATHDHADFEKRQKGLREEVKDFVLEELHAGVVTTKTAYDKLLDRINTGLMHASCKPKSYEQFDNHFRYKRTQFNGGAGPITVKDIENMARQHATIPSEQELDKAYVVHSQFKGASSFQVVFSTRRLIAATRSATMISTDATYKLNYHSFPVLMLAIVDYRNHVFPVALALCGNEKTADFVELFRSLNIAALRLNLQNHSPQYVIADGAPAITAAARLVFPDIKRCMCWFHVKKNVEDALQRLVPDDRLRWRMLRDLSYIQLSITKEVFEGVFALYAAEYDPVAHDAVFSAGKTCRVYIYARIHVRRTMYIAN
ncbi:hypothetical protein FOL47_011301 [Perkinsus chesapeaki]|uniref:MULE transposase domain-containing protein n=1 Tax=Perkinsus chesapeaki TaxID=330153 RepID=A0A7J6KXH3_PERCH|nr:hypothetical protein FOL47_011301 [Perkinsus chesapeaki]